MEGTQPRPPEQTNVIHMDEWLARDYGESMTQELALHRYHELNELIIAKQTELVRLKQERSVLRHVLRGEDGPA